MTDMTYYILRIMVHLTLMFMFRRIELTGLKNIPRDKQVILIGNHPTAFMEAIILACWLCRPMHFMIRSDMWKPGFLSWLLDSIHGVPVYRKSEGFNSKKDNKDTFKICVDLINSKKLLIIFAEGSHSMVRRLRPFKKGTARIAMQALEAKPEEDIIAIPVGAIFNAPNTLRRTAHISIGKGVGLRQFLTENRSESINNMTEAMHVATQNELPDITEEEELLFERELYKQARFDKSFEKQWKDAYKVLSQYDDKKKYELIKKFKKCDESLENKTLKSQLNVFHWLALVIFAIPACIGKSIHWPIIYASESITRKLVNKKEFYYSLLLVILMVLMFVYYIIIIVILGLFLGQWWAVLAIVILGLIAVRYFDIWRIVRA